MYGSTIDADAISVVALSRKGLFEGLIICMNVVMLLLAMHLAPARPR